MATFKTMELFLQSSGKIKTKIVKLSSDIQRYKDQRDILIVDMFAKNMQRVSLKETVQHQKKALKINIADERAIRSYSNLLGKNLDATETSVETVQRWKVIAKTTN